MRKKSVFIIIAAVTIVAGFSSVRAMTFPGYYGAQIGGDELANTVIGGPSGQIGDYSFLNLHAGTLQSVNWYQVINSAGYASGTNGVIRLQIETDDGTASHLPSGTVLASTSSNPVSNQPTDTFTSPPVLAANTIYHVVFDNTDAASTTNYSSLDLIYQIATPAPAQPDISDVNWGHSFSAHGGSFSLRAGFTPIMQLTYSDGTIVGNGYRFVHIRDIETISGTSTVQEAFTVSATSTNQSVTSVSVRLGRWSGNDPLTATLKKSDGTFIASASLPAGSISSATSAGVVCSGCDAVQVIPAWYTFNFSSPQFLAVGNSYDLVLSTATTSQYKIFTLQKGIANSSPWSPVSDFYDGLAQFNPGTGYVGWPTSGGGPDNLSDLQFYFTNGFINKTFSGNFTLSLGKNSIFQ